MKRIISLTLAALMLIILAVPAFASEAEATTTTPTPITNADEFLAMESGKTYILVNDIDFGGKVYDSFLIPGTKFVAGLDGDGHAIKNFKLEATDCEHDLAIFQQLGGGYIKNLSVGTVSAPIELKVENPIKGTYAILAASTQDQSQTPEIDNVHIYAEVSIISTTKTDLAFQFGGFIGYARNYKITNSTMNGNITLGNSGEEHAKYRNVGGFIGVHKQDWAEGTLENCEQNASISNLNNAKEGRVAGFIAYTDALTDVLKNCTNNGVLTLGTSAGAGYAAGFIGAINNPLYGTTTIEDCANYGSITYNATNDETDKEKTYVGGIVAAVTRGMTVVKKCTNGVLFDSNATNVNEIVGAVIETNFPDVTEEGNKTTADGAVAPTPVDTTPVDTTAPAETEAPITPEDTKAPETEPASPSTGDHSLVIILLAAVMSLAGAAFAFIARRDS